MFQSYLKTAWRSLLRGKSFTLINVTGLALGMAGSMIIVLWLLHEISFDKFHDKKDRLHEVYGLVFAEGKNLVINQTSQPLAPALKSEFPEVENSCRFAPLDNFLLSAGDKSLTRLKGGFVDPSFLTLFSFPSTMGGSVKAPDNVYSIVITETLSRKLFGTTDAVNKTVRIDSTDNFVVQAVLKDLPSNTRFDFDYLLPWAYLQKLGWNNDSWLSNNVSSFVLLKPNASVEDFNKKIKDLTRRHTKEDVWTHFLFPLHQWHLYAKFENGIPAGGRIETVRLFAIIAVLLVLIGCINFMNLSTARSEKRAKEVGIRKVAGAGRSILIGQFIIESTIVAAIGCLLALLIVQFTLPLFSAIIETPLQIPYSNGWFWLAILAFVVVTGLLAGSYPAFYLSSFKPVSIFKGKFKQLQTLISPRKVLVVIQFSFAVILVIATIVVQNQIRYAQNRPVGYSVNNLIYVDFVGDVGKNYPLIRQELLNRGVAVSVTKTMTTIARKGVNTWGLRWQGRDPNFEGAIGVTSADADLVKTTGLQLLSGRDLDIYKFPADSTSVLLNETAVKTMGFKEPLGQVITEVSGPRQWRVVGVVKDYVINSPYEKVPPMVIQGAASHFSVMHIKFNNARSTAENLAMAETIFKTYNPVYPFDYRFIDQEYEQNFKSEQRTRSLSGLFAVMAIVISCLGLFGLSAFMAESRLKEIGVRKVLGASSFTIARLLSADFLKLVGIAILIASPIAWYAMNTWLADFPYRIKIGPVIFLFASAVAILIALITISFQSVKAALANPVKSLRSE